MKKLTGFFVLSLLFVMSVFAQYKTIPRMLLGVSKGETVPNVVAGQVIYAQENAKKAKKSSMDLPEELSNGVVIVNFEEEYYYLGEKRVITCQMVYSNVKPEASFKKASELNPVYVDSEAPLGIATDDVTVVIRIHDLDPHLAFCAKNLPVEVGSYWYFDLESLAREGDKFLSYQPIESKDTRITFPDGISESLEELITNRDPDVFSSFPPMPIRLTTTMNSYPKKMHAPETSAERDLFNMYSSLMSVEAIAEFEGYTLHFQYSENYADYFEKEYTLGDPVILYGNILYVYKGELFLYGWEFSFTDPDDFVPKRINQILELNGKPKTYSNTDAK